MNTTESGEVPVAIQKILVIEDDEEICMLLEDYLIDNGFKVRCILDGAEGLKRALKGGWDIILLDIMLPSMTGLEVLERIRRTSAVPIILLTAMGEESDRVKGLDTGADEYIVKPFSPRELLARIQSLLRRSGLKHNPPQNIIEWKPFLFDSTHREMSIDGKIVSLTDQEFETMMTLVKNRGRILSRDELSQLLMGRTVSAFDRAMDIRISRLRNKISPWSDCIRSVRGKGYEFIPPHELPEKQDDEATSDQP
jgi:DNA-binding response OmpR family regulator